MPLLLEHGGATAVSAAASGGTAACDSDEDFAPSALLLASPDDATPADEARYPTTTGTTLAFEGEKHHTTLSGDRTPSLWGTSLTADAARNPHLTAACPSSGGRELGPAVQSVPVAPAAEEVGEDFK